MFNPCSNCGADRGPFGSPDDKGHECEDQRPTPHWGADVDILDGRALHDVTTGESVYEFTERERDDA